MTWQVLTGDCLEILPSVAGVTTTFTSPPYNTLGSRIPPQPSGLWAKRGGGLGFVEAVTSEGYPDDMDEQEYQAQQLRAAFIVGSEPSYAKARGQKHEHKYRHDDAEQRARAFSAKVLAAVVYRAGVTVHERTEEQALERMEELIRDVTSLDEQMSDENASALITECREFAPRVVRDEPRLLAGINRVMHELMTKEPKERTGKRAKGRRGRR